MPCEHKNQASEVNHTVVECGSLSIVLDINMAIDFITQHVLYNVMCGPELSRNSV